MRILKKSMPRKEVDNIMKRRRLIELIREEERELVRTLYERIEKHVDPELDPVEDMTFESRADSPNENVDQVVQIADQILVTHNVPPPPIMVSEKDLFQIISFLQPTQVLSDFLRYEEILFCIYAYKKKQEANQQNGQTQEKRSLEKGTEEPVKSVKPQTPKD